MRRLKWVLLIASTALVGSAFGVATALIIDNKAEPASFKISLGSNLDTPLLSLNQTTGVVTWDNISGASKYVYYINDGEFSETTTRSVTLSEGQVISVMASSDVEGVNSSSWSKPVSYVNIDETYKYVNIAFRDAPGLETVTHPKGNPFKLPSNPTKGNYTFDGWYKDPFFKEAFEDNSIIDETTVLYAKWLTPTFLDGYYFIKCNDHITNSEKGFNPDVPWGFIPMHYDAARSAELGNRKAYVAYITTDSSTSEANPAEYIVMDGCDDLGDRKYWKKPTGVNFDCKSPGTWRVTFSIEYQWDYHSGEGKVNAFLESYTSKSIPVTKNRVLTVTDILPTPAPSINKDTYKVSWAAVDGAEKYQYSINNGEIQETNTTEINLYQGQSIVVRAIHANKNYSSKWSAPLVFNYEHKPEPTDAIITFFNTEIPSIKQTLNAKLTKPADPTKSGYTFYKWYADVAMQNEFDFNQNITGNTCLYAKWNEVTDTVRYKLLNPSGTAISDIKLNKAQTGFNEYYGTFKVAKGGTGTYKLVDTLDSNRVLYSHYIDDEVAEYQVCFSFDHLYNNGKFATVNHTRYNLYFTNNLDTSHSPYAHYWSKSVSNRGTSWPGDALTWVKKNEYNQDIWTISLYKDYYEYIIFNNHNNGKQTVDISLSGVTDKTQWYCTGSSSPYSVGKTTYSD